MTDPKPGMRTPGVYIVERNAFPNSIVEVATAVPAFIGHTPKATNGKKDLTHKPYRITSMQEFHQYFGEAPTAQFARFSLMPAADASPAAVDMNEPLALRDATPIEADGAHYLLKQTGGRHLLFHCALQHFFQNGGGACYIVSVGPYNELGVADPAGFKEAIAALAMESEPTMLVIPEAVTMKREDCFALQREAIDHCRTMQSRLAILDVWEGYRDLQGAPNVVDAFRDGIGNTSLDYGAAYYPWVHTGVVQERDLGEANLDEPGRALLAASKSGTLVKRVIAEMATRLNVLPPSAAMAGIYTMVDNTRGVWKAPANVRMNNVVSPTVAISSEQQENLNVSAQGKSINAIRSFVGEGALVWGARTLDGNSLDWRYVNVRRTMIMLEQSIKLAAKALVFEPNVANTWVTVKSMTANFLTSVWKRGGLAGAAPGDAFNVFCGLGETMTSEDILEGIMRVTVLVAIARPAEFIEITFQQQMQKS